ncbi:hypothetical protein ACPYOC_12370 [Ornithinimicrobium sp. W1665]|uniref:hypothetical protein n=1 Tax=Ornithinimicrobium sp. W1665 TaxID=3416666 RepID=UPI003CEEB7E4
MGFVTNVYERTYRDVLSPGYVAGIVSSQRHQMDEVVVLINNVDSRGDAAERAENLVRRGEITSFAFVADHIDSALATAGIGRRQLGKRPYLVDFGLVMPHVLSTRWLLGWDAESRLVDPQNWIEPAIDLMQADPRVFHVSLHRPARTEWEPVLEREAAERRGRYIYNWGFSDHVFLVERQRLIGAQFRTFAPAAVVRHAPHPYTFEFRMESYQRAAGLFRATAADVHYDTNTSPPGVLARTGGSRWDDMRIRALWQFGWTVLDRLPSAFGPRFKRYPPDLPRSSRTAR